MPKNIEEQIIELRKRNKGYKKIARQVGVSRDMVRRCCSKNGLGGVKGLVPEDTIAKREKKFEKTFNKMFPSFKYHSGFINVDSPLKIQCLECGKILERNGQCIRNGTNIVCEGCTAIQKGKEEEQKQQLRKQRLMTRVVNIITSRIEYKEREPLLYKVCQRCGEDFKGEALNSVHCKKCLKEIKEIEKERRALWEGKVVKCKECGQAFEMKSIRSKYCSTGCLSRAENRMKEIRKRERIQKNGKVDYSITLPRLIKRDSNICQICSKECNDEDCEIDREGNFIVGKNYPSVDHIIPVARGGTHTWDNVQLAHHHCNSIKNDNIYASVKGNGQLKVI